MTFSPVIAVELKVRVEWNMECLCGFFLMYVDDVLFAETCVCCYRLLCQNIQANCAVYVKDRFGVLKMLKPNFVGECTCV